VRFYLDEDVSSHAVLAAARTLGLDIESSAEHGRGGTTDDVQLEYAASLGRSIVTQNGSDFEEQTRIFQAAGRPHAGVVIVPHSIPNDQVRRFARAMQAIAAYYPDGLDPYAVIWLRPVSD